MINRLLAGVAGVILGSGVAFADTYPPPPPPSVPLAPPAAVSSPDAVSPPPAVSGPSSSATTTITPAPDGDHREVTIHKEVDEKGNEVTEKDVHREGLSGSTETHIKKEKKGD
jgi:hypothetical protein